MCRRFRYIDCLRRSHLFVDTGYRTFVNYGCGGVCKSGCKHCLYCYRYAGWLQQHGYGHCYRKPTAGRGHDIRAFICLCWLIGYNGQLCSRLLVFVHTIGGNDRRCRCGDRHIFRNNDHILYIDNRLWQRHGNKSGERRCDTCRSYGTVQCRCGFRCAFLTVRRNMEQQ